MRHVETLATLGGWDFAAGELRWRGFGRRVSTDTDQRKVAAVCGEKKRLSKHRADGDRCNIASHATNPATL
eukprot:scaffold23_cov113-Isochrysis_galbana.AAC.7